MESQKPIHESEYAVLSPVERNARLVELIDQFPKSSPHAQWNNLINEENKVMKVHTNMFKVGEESEEGFMDAFKSLSSFEEREELEDVGDIAELKRKYSTEKRHVFGKISELLEFAPTTDEFKQVLIRLLDNGYDGGSDHINDNPIIEEIMLGRRDTGGFFNEDNAFDTEVIAYRYEKESMNYFKDIGRQLDYCMRMGLIESDGFDFEARDREDEMFLDRWERAIREKYETDPQV
ncbi:MAG: hypothetical protein A2687_01945 [Candidatus Levybacteria bacterium RIFCSPHIGHO2_01_FULL_38_26]|nr:MAG: hypothetical protein A2687_01945 [Candidatus Levybacteria bacterium RIFCSPHIGHO2_01_FULL_38_26]